MKFANIKDFHKHLSSLGENSTLPVYAVIGKDHQEVKEALRPLLTHPAYECIPFDAEKLQPQELLQEISSLDLFGKTKLIFVRGLDKGKTPLKECVEKVLDHPLQDVLLIFSADTLPSNTKLYKKIDKIGGVVSLSSHLKDWEKEKLGMATLQEAVAQAGKKIDAQAAKYFIDRAGTDFSSLSSEIEKLLIYCAEIPQIRLREVEAITSDNREEVVWNLSDALLNRDKKKCFEISEELLDGGAALIFLLRQIRKQCEQGLYILSLLETGKSPDQASEKFPRLSGFILQKQLKAAKTFGLRRFKKALVEIDRTEFTAKNCQVDEKTLLQTLLTKVML